jgi:hypothetical protein
VNASNFAANTAVTPAVYDFNLSNNITSGKASIANPGASYPFMGVGSLYMSSGRNASSRLTIPLPNNTNTAYSVTMWCYLTNIIQYSGVISCHTTPFSSGGGLDSGTVMIYSNDSANIYVYTVGSGITYVCSQAALLNNWVFVGYSVSNVSGANATITLLIKNASGNARVHEKEKIVIIKPTEFALTAFPDSAWTN